MPEMGGPELAKRFTGLHPGTRVLFCSGYGDLAGTEYPKSEPEYAFLPKPFSPLALALKVREVLDN